VCYTFAGLKVEAIVVVLGWFVETKGQPEIKVMNAKYLVNTFLPSLKPRFTEDQLRGVKRRFDERCRDPKFWSFHCGGKFNDPAR
jgi:hypothetical protein